MATPDVIDFAALTAPIDGDSPSGVETRRHPEASQLFNQARSAREAARTAEQVVFEQSYLPPAAGESDRSAETPRADWNAVLRPSVVLLTKYSKDLWVATWLTEALIRLHGYAGLRDGARLLRELCEQYWGSLHPLPDPDEDETIEMTLSQLAGLNNQIGKSSDPIDQIQIGFDAASGHKLTGLDYKIAQNPKAPTATRPDGSPRPTLETFAALMRKGDVAFFAELRDDVRGAKEEFQKLVQLLDERCGRDASGFALTPPTSGITRSLQEMHDLIFRLTAPLFPDAPEVTQATQDGEASSDTTATSSGAVSGVPGRISNREDAFRELSRVADYFRHTEPHSPVSFALDQVIRWGRMSLPELLTELIPNNDARTDMFRRTGIPTEKN